MFELAKDLKAKGYTVALLSNMYKPIAWVTKRLPTTRLFSPLVISADVGVSKPKPEIYKIMLERLALPAEVCLFIDDRPENIAAAAAQNFQVRLVLKPDTTAQELRVLLNL